MKFFIKEFFRNFPNPHLLKKSLVRNLIFYAVYGITFH